MRNRIPPGLKRPYSAAKAAFVIQVIAMFLWGGAVVACAVSVYRDLHPQQLRPVRNDFGNL